MLCGSCVRPPALPSLPCLRWLWASAPTSRFFSSSTASCSVRCHFRIPSEWFGWSGPTPAVSAVPVYSGTVALFLRRTSHSFESAAIYDYIPSNVNLVQEGEAIPLKALRTTSDFFHVFAMEPAMGRDFNSGDMVQNTPGVAVMSNAVWRERFASDPNILGKAITLGNRSTPSSE